MEYNAKDMTQIYDRCGWYEDDKKVSNLETGARKYKAAYPKQIFLDSPELVEEQKTGDSKQTQ